MSMFCCERSCRCAPLSVLAGIAVGVIAAFLQVTGTITIMPVFYLITFGIAVGLAAITLITAAIARRATPCALRGMTVLITGILGTTFTSLLLLAVSFAATSLVGAVFVGILLFFFTLTITGSTCFARHLVDDE